MTTILFSGSDSDFISIKCSKKRSAGTPSGGYTFDEMRINDYTVDFYQNGEFTGWAWLNGERGVYVN